MNVFKDYKQAHTVAKEKANAINRDYGLEFNRASKEYVIFMLPAPKNRYGHELSCEVVSSDN